MPISHCVNQCSKQLQTVNFWRVFSFFLCRLVDLVTVAADLASLMAENSNLFNEVMSIQVPELIPFENLQMQKEFEALTLQLSN